MLQVSKLGGVNSPTWRYKMKKLLKLCNKYNLKYKGRNSKGFYLVYNETNRQLIKGCTIESTISIINKYYKDV